MGGTLEKLKTVVGTGLVRTGLGLLGYRKDVQGAPGPPESGVLEEEDEDARLPPNVPPAVLSDVAREMLAAGTPTWNPPKKVVEENTPLKGSVADRLRTARREMGR